MTLSIKISQEVTFDAAHRLLYYSGNCNNLHGHTWRASVCIESNRPLDNCGMLVDYRFIKNYFKENFDHRAILNENDPLIPILIGLEMSVTTLEDNPTAENLAHKIAHDFVNMLKLDIENCTESIEVRVHESTENYAEVCL